jgi:excisionase family DNA binding protein
MSHELLPPADPWLDVIGAAKHSLTSVSTILRAARRGDLRGYKINRNRVWRFRTSDIDRWIQQSAEPVEVVIRRFK